jgi:carbonic anhydrase
MHKYLKKFLNKKLWFFLGFLGSEPILNEQSKKGKLIVKGALYNMDNGKVTFLDHLD